VLVAGAITGAEGSFNQAGGEAQRVTYLEEVRHLVDALVEAMTGMAAGEGADDEHEDQRPGGIEQHA